MHHLSSILLFISLVSTTLLALSSRAFFYSSLCLSSPIKALSIQLGTFSRTVPYSLGSAFLKFKLLTVKYSLSSLSAYILLECATWTRRLPWQVVAMRGRGSPSSSMYNSPLFHIYHRT